LFNDETCDSGGAGDGLVAVWDGGRRKAAISSFARPLAEGFAVKLEQQVVHFAAAAGSEEWTDRCAVVRGRLAAESSVVPKENEGQSNEKLSTDQSSSLSQAVRHGKLKFQRATVQVSHQFLDRRLAAPAFQPERGHPADNRRPL